MATVRSNREQRPRTQSVNAPTRIIGCRIGDCQVLRMEIFRLLFRERFVNRLPGRYEARHHKLCIGWETAPADRNLPERIELLVGELGLLECEFGPLETAPYRVQSEFQSEADTPETDALKVERECLDALSAKARLHAHSG